MIVVDVQGDARKQLLLGRRRREAGKIRQIVDDLRHGNAGIRLLRPVAHRVGHADDPAAAAVLVVVDDPGQPVGGQQATAQVLEPTGKTGGPCLLGKLPEGFLRAAAHAHHVLIPRLAEADNQIVVAALAHLLGPDKKPEHLDELQSAGASDDMRPHADRRQTLGTGADEFHLVFAVAGFRQRFGKAEGKLFDASVTAETGQDEGDSCHDVLSARAREKGLAGPSRCTLQAGKSKGSAQGFHAAPAGAENQPFLPVFPALYYRACSILHSPRARRCRNRRSCPPPAPKWTPSGGIPLIFFLSRATPTWIILPSACPCSAAGWSDTATAWASWPSRAGRTRGRASPTSPAWAAPACSPG